MSIRGTSATANGCGGSINRKSGFTLVEVIVMLGIMALLTAVVVRNVTPRLNAAEASALVDNLDSLSTAVRRFRANVGQYPNELRQLSQAPGTTPVGETVISSNGLCGTAASEAAWRGPYLDQRPTATGLKSGDITVANALARISGTTPASATAGRAELVFSASEVANEVATRAERAVDGVVNFSAGMVQFSSPVLSYRIPINGC